MFAVLAFVSFLIALILHLVGNGTEKYVLDFLIAGAALVAAHFAWGVPVPWARPHP